MSVVRILIKAFIWGFFCLLGNWGVLKDLVNQIAILKGVLFCKKQETLDTILELQNLHAQHGPRRMTQGIPTQSVKIIVNTLLEEENTNLSKTFRFFWLSIIFLATLMYFFEHNVDFSTSKKNNESQILQPLLSTEEISELGCEVLNVNNEAILIYNFSQLGAIINLRGIKTELQEKKENTTFKNHIFYNNDISVQLIKTKINPDPMLPNEGVLYIHYKDKYEELEIKQWCGC